MEIWRAINFSVNPASDWKNFRIMPPFAESGSGWLLTPNQVLQMLFVWNEKWLQVILLFTFVRPAKRFIIFTPYCNTTHTCNAPVVSVLRCTCVWVGNHLHTAHLFGMHINSPLYRWATAGQTLHATTKRRDAAMWWSQRVGRTRPQKNQNQLVNSSRGVQMKPRYLVLIKCVLDGEREKKKKKRNEKCKNKQVATQSSVPQPSDRVYRLTATHLHVPQDGSKGLGFPIELDLLLLVNAFIWGSVQQ